MPPVEEDDEIPYCPYCGDDYNPDYPDYHRNCRLIDQEED